MSEGPNLAAQQQAMNHGKQKGGHPLDINSAFGGAHADGADVIMRGHGVDEMITHNKQILEEFAKHASSSSSSGGGSDNSTGLGMGGGADALKPMGAGAPMAPSYTEMVSMGAKSDKGGSWGRE